MVESSTSSYVSDRKRTIPGRSWATNRNGFMGVKELEKILAPITSTTVIAKGNSIDSMNIHYANCGAGVDIEWSGLPWGNGNNEKGTPGDLIHLATTYAYTYPFQCRWGLTELGFWNSQHTILSSRADVIAPGDGDFDSGAKLDFDLSFVALTTCSNGQADVYNSQEIHAYPLISIPISVCKVESFENEGYERLIIESH